MGVSFVKREGHWDLQATDDASLIDLLKLEEPLPDNGDHWGPWIYNDGVLTHKTKNVLPIKLELIKTHKDVVIALEQVADRRAFTAADVGYLMHALEGCIHFDELR